MRTKSLPMLRGIALRASSHTMLDSSAAVRTAHVKPDYFHRCVRTNRRLGGRLFGHGLAYWRFAALALERSHECRAMFRAWADPRGRNQSGRSLFTTAGVGC